MTLKDLINNIPKSKYNYLITSKAYYNDQMESSPIEAVYLDDNNEELIIEW